MAIFIPDEVDFMKKVNRDRERHNDKRVNLPGRKGNPKCACTKQQSWKICEAKTDQTE